MTKRIIDVHPDGTASVEAPPPPAPRTGEVIARTVVLVGGASLLLGGLLGYAFGYLDGKERKEPGHDV